MAWLANRLMRGASNRANERLAAEIGSYGPGTATLALALGHACYPNAIYEDNGLQDVIVRHLKQLTPGPCDYHKARGYVESWLDKGEISTNQVFVRVWGMAPDDFIQRFFEESGIGADDDANT